MAHIFVLYGGSKNIDVGTVNKQIVDRVSAYTTVTYEGGGYSLTTKDMESHISFKRDNVAKTFKKWLTTNKTKFGIKKLDILTDKQYDKLQTG